MKQTSVLHRREVLWAATGTFAYVSSAGLAQAVPVPPAELNIKTCRSVPVRTPPGKENCCLRDGTGLPVYRFQFEDLPMRVRKPAHILSQDPEYVAKYNKAYAIMKRLPDTDPRSFNNQWKVHCAFCDGAYPEPKNPKGLALQYHGSWTFLPWHRMYLYFHERILGELIGDPSFALPFWNWDNQRSVGGNMMPLMFTEICRGVKNEELRNAIRNPAHFPPAIIDLTGKFGPPNLSENLAVLHRAVVLATSAETFFGGPYRAGQSHHTKTPGTNESDGHNIVHRWTGSLNDPRYPDNQDMGVFVFAGRDPIFYNHHANVDRLWTVWKSLDDQSTRKRLRIRKEPNDPDFLDTKFAFYDHRQRLVHVKISDTLDPRKLCFMYEHMDSDSDWINYKATPSGVPKPSPEDIEPFARTEKVLTKDKSSSFLLIRRDPTDEEVAAYSDEGYTPDDLEETLVVKGVKVPKTSHMAFRVFINLPSSEKSTLLNLQEFAGIISHIPHNHDHDHSMSDGGVTFKLSVGAILRSLDIEPKESVSVTFVPQAAEEDVPFDGVDLEWR